MKNRIITPLIMVLAVGCLLGCSNKKGNASNLKDEVVLPDIFKNTNYGYGGVEPGVALYLDNNNQPRIQNVTPYLDFYDIQFDALPLKKKDNMYFLPFKVTDQFIDDGYLKNGIEYKFWLSYTEPNYYCGLSKNDDTLTSPDIELMEGVL